MTTLERLPLFPLNTVLFPGMPLPLHIFEPRYRSMISQCIEQRKPFGVTLIQEGFEVGETSIPHEVGTSAYITEVDHLSDGRMNIRAVGRERFKIRSLEYDKPYLVGLVEGFPVQRASQIAENAVGQGLAVSLRTYLGALAQTIDLNLRIDHIPEDLMALAFLTASVLQVPMVEKQDLLAIPDLLQILRTEQRLLVRELAFVEYMIRQEIHWRENPTSFSAN